MVTLGLEVDGGKPMKGKSGEMCISTCDVNRGGGGRKDEREASEVVGRGKPHRERDTSGGTTWDTH